MVNQYGRYYTSKMRRDQRNSIRRLEPVHDGQIGDDDCEVKVRRDEGRGKSIVARGALMASIGLTAAVVLASERLQR
jgi:hypothetical protein